MNVWTGLTSRRVTKQRLKVNVRKTPTKEEQCDYYVQKHAELPSAKYPGWCSFQPFQNQYNSNEKAF